MKKYILNILSVLIISSMACAAYAKTVSNSGLSTAIQMYKQANYSQCYEQLNDVIKKDPSNALAYYYLGMTSAQLGKKDEAIANYERAITLSPDGNNLNRYAKKGKRCLETPDKCADAMYESEEEKFIINKKGARFTEEVRSDYERLKIENLMRQMNRSEDIQMDKFKEYKDFSSSVPTDEEIVSAMRVLQRAGFGNVMNNNYQDLSFINGGMQNPMFNMMGTGSVNPQLIQALLTNNMAQGF